jgi:hypothetical protein
MSTATNPVLAEAFKLAGQHNLHIYVTRNGAGDITKWRVYREMDPDRRVFLGARVSPSALLRFVRELSMVEPAR